MKDKPEWSIKDNINCDYTREIICPYCGHEFADGWEVDANTNGFLDNQECDVCGEIFQAERNIDVTYSTQRTEEGAREDG